MITDDDTLKESWLMDGLCCEFSGIQRGNT